MVTFARDDFTHDTTNDLRKQGQREKGSVESVKRIVKVGQERVRDAVEGEGGGKKRKKEEEDGRNDTYLSGTSLGKIRHDVNLFRSSEWSDDFTNLQCEFLGKTSFVTWIKREFSADAAKKEGTGIG